ncbi:unnamed protein product [Rotaria sordida]|uniref:EF-hand domain-containing protein n=1 Tax=Rotaria sordida TaxID=392033 RepID=A0A819FQ82_9BILA|nr:unnamed protein product [Rotaria sordida]CAF0915633.1 unnamed protein product [Rotaria sordida]CAF0974997.1 unnamed protein product [Rotaria sordida]CAF1091903.1 unnamed protein product [Rotaria sordida]CAF1093490.1 unnamed protein product [Rotaria sordida]
MDDQEINFAQLLDAFQLFDTNKDGAISFDELRAVCQKLQMPIDTMRLKYLFHNRDNISFDEFCRIVQDYRSNSNDAYFQETFNAFDKNSDGYITTKEIKQTMKELGEPITDKQAKAMLKSADSNRDGKLSKDEFRTLFNHLTHFKNSTLRLPSPSNITNKHNSQ